MNILYNNVCIESLGYLLPENKLTSSEIETQLSPIYEKLKLPFGRLEMMSGIKERRLWNKGTLPSQAAIKAGQEVLHNSGFSIDKIGCLIHCAVCRDCMEPATASIIHHSLNLSKETLVYDISNACLGILNGIISVANMIELGQIKAGLLVAGECAESLIEGTIHKILSDPAIDRKTIKPHFASLTIGSAAVAMLLTHTSISKNQHRLIGAAIKTASEHNKLCQGDTVNKILRDNSNNHLEMQTDSEQLMKTGCELAGVTWEVLKGCLNWDNNTPNRVFTHQVGIAHRKLLYQTTGIDLGKDFPTLEFLGNVGSVSLPITFALGIEKNLVVKGDKIALLGIGSGLNCIMMGVEW
ncbi:MAG: 3-oxoacyl-ACP synthase III [bacterium]